MRRDKVAAVKRRLGSSAQEGADALDNAAGGGHDPMNLCYVCK
jgi:hypothetical protein